MLVTLVIVSILAIASYYFTRGASKESIVKSAQSQLLTVYSVQKSLFQERGSFTSDISVLSGKVSSVSLSNFESTGPDVVFVILEDGILHMGTLVGGGVCVTLTANDFNTFSFGSYSTSGGLSCTL